MSPEEKDKRLKVIEEKLAKITVNPPLVCETCGRPLGTDRR